MKYCMLKSKTSQSRIFQVGAFGKLAILPNFLAMYGFVVGLYCYLIIESPWHAVPLQGGC